MKDITAKDIMNPNVISVPLEMTVRQLTNFFTEKMISGAPVTDEGGKLLGVVSLSDIVRNDERRSAIVKDTEERSYYLHGWEDDLDVDEVQELHLEIGDDLTVKEIMTPLIFKVTETERISEMADIMISGRIHRLFVTRDDKVVGIITSLDMLKAIREYTK